MAQVKIYGLNEHLAARRQDLSDAIHESLMEALGLPAEKRFQRFIALDRDAFVYPEDRSARYTSRFLSSTAVRARRSAS